MARQQNIFANIVICRSIIIGRVWRTLLSVK